ncbi:MAG: hypothetical protein NTU69_13060 [Proteobacteria bacterium]|nr:hypothetical protein [Pseudomonadota bacterium]
MNPFFTIYTIAWGISCILALIFYLTEKEYYSIIWKNYRRFLFVPWKVSTFLIAGTGMVVIAPYTGDPTWDYVDAGFMSLFTFISSPWAVGTLYKVFARRLSIKHGFIAFCVWMFSASWSYDLYLLLKDGYYPLTWLTNLLASSVLYVSAGLLWSLDWREGKGIILSFREEDWPYPSKQKVFMKIFWFVLPFMAIASGIVLYFII